MVIRRNERWWLALIAIDACGGGGGKDDCTQIKDKVRPVVEAMMRDAGKPMPPGIETDLQEMCAPPTDDEQRTFRTCIVAASSQADAAACLQPLFESYRGEGSAAAARDKRRADAVLAVGSDAGAALSVTSDASAAGSGSPAAVSDAGVLAPPTPVDPTKLPLIGVTDRDRGDETQVLAANADADRLLVELWPPSQPILAVWVGKSITGQLVAPSRLAAARSIAAATGIAPRPIEAHAHSVDVDLQFAKAPQADLLRLLADVMRANIVVKPGTYPDLDIVGRRMTASDVVAAIAAIDGLSVVRDGSIIFLVPRGTKLPKLAPARQVIDLSIAGGTAQQAIAAMAAVATVPLHGCDSKPIDLTLHRVTVGEALRALEIATGTTFDATARCPIADLATVGASPALTVTASAGTRRAAIVVSGGVPGLVRNVGSTDIGHAFVTINGTNIQLLRHVSPPPNFDLDYAAFLAHLHRTEAVFREGTRWFARVVTVDGTTITLDTDKNLATPIDLRTYPPRIGPDGVELVAADHHTKKRIPLASK